MIGILVILFIALVVIGVFLFAMVATEGKVTITDNLTIHSERPYFRRPEYVHGYCADCGHQRAIKWEVIKYDTNTGKPSLYKWLVYCPKCDKSTYSEGDYGSVDEYQYVNREYGAIPGADKPISPTDSFERGWHEIMNKEVYPIETLWDGINND